MVRLLRYLLTFVAFVVAVQGRRKLLMLSFDGFREMYHDTFYLPWFRYVRQHGSWASNVSSTFPSDTYPNHYSIVTGRHPESHGIVANEFYDPDLKDTFHLGYNSAKWWNQTVPIWKTAEDAGIKSASYFWPGSETEEVTGLKPPFYHSYNDEAKITSFAQRLDGVLTYFLEEDREFVTMYYNEPDHAMHNLGPDNPEMEATLRTADDYLGMVIMKVEDAGLSDSLDIIICSDHGAASRGSDKIVFLDAYINATKVKYIFQGALVAMHALDPDDTDSIVDALQDTPHVRAFRKGNSPEHIHYGNNRRIEEILVMADRGWYIRVKTSTSGISGGGHGYDVYYPEMKPTLLAIGPSFKENFELASYAQTKDIYSLAGHLLGITLYPGNSTEVLHAMLRNENEPETSSDTVLIIVLTVVSVISALLLAGVVYYFVQKRNVITATALQDITKSSTRDDSEVVLGINY